MNNVVSHYKNLVEFLGMALGNHVEIILQDCHDTNSIVAIANGTMSQHQIGEPLTEFASQLMTTNIWKEMDYIQNHEIKTAAGKILYASIYFLKEKDTLCGMLSINVDVSIYQNLSQQILELSGIAFPASRIAPLPKKRMVNFSTAVSDIIASVIGGYSIPTDRMVQEEKIEVVRTLNEQGIFSLKGAVSCVANQLYSSEASIYRYLSKISKNETTTHF